MDNMNLSDYLKNYESLSLAKSIYTITSWISNRNYIGIVDNLNKKFIEVEESDGTIEILTYEDFKKLFEFIIANTKGNSIYSEDFTSDIGEVRFYSGGDFKKIIIGNGSEDVYEACFFIESLVQEDDYLKTMWNEILNYEDFILSKFYTIDYSQANEFECPPEKYFKTVFENYESLNNPTLKFFFQDFNSSNKELYDFFTKKMAIQFFYQY